MRVPRFLCRKVVKVVHHMSIRGYVNRKRAPDSVHPKLDTRSYVMWNTGDDPTYLLNEMMNNIPQWCDFSPESVNHLIERRTYLVPFWRNEVRPTDQTL